MTSVTTLATYRSIRKYWLDYWLSFGNHIGEEQIEAGIASLEHIFLAAGIDKPLSLAPDMDEQAVFETIADACFEGAWDAVGNMVDDLFRQHMKVAA